MRRRRRQRRATGPGTPGQTQGPLGPWPWPRVHWDPWSQAQGPLGPWVPGPGSIGTLGPLGPVATATMEGFVWDLGQDFHNKSAGPSLEGPPGCEDFDILYPASCILLFLHPMHPSIPASCILCILVSLHLHPLQECGLYPAASCL